MSIDDQKKSKAQLIEEVAQLRRRLAEYEKKYPPQETSPSDIKFQEYTDEVVDSPHIVHKHLFEENQEIIDYLENSRLFGPLNRKLLRRLAPLSEIIDYARGEKILEEGQPNNKVYFLIRGKVSIYASGELILSLNRVGDIFGEMSILSSKPCTASVITVTPVRVFTIRSKDVGDYTDVGQGAIQNILYRLFAKILSEKLSLTTDKAKKYVNTNFRLSQTQEELKTYHEQLGEKIEELEQTTVSKNYVDNIIKSMADSLIVVNPNGTIQTVNQETLELLGYQEEELIGKSVEIIFDEEDIFQQRNLQGLMTKVSVRNLEMVYFTKDGQGIPVLFSGSVMYDKTNQVEGFVCVAQDITERKQAEQELRFNKYTLDNMAEGVSVVKQSDGSIIYANPGFGKMFGYKPEETIGKKTSDMNAYDQTGQGSSGTEIRQALENEGMWGGEIHTIRKDGSRFWTQAKVTRFEHHEHGPVWLSVREDITKRKKVEQQIQSITDAMFQYLETGNWQSASKIILKSALFQTESEYGFVGILNGSEVHVLTYEGIRWHGHIGRDFYEAASRAYETMGYLIFDRLDTLFGQVVTTKRTVISNDPASDPRAAGRLPAGHPPLKKFLGVPIFSSGTVVGLIGLANRKEGYSQNDEKKIEVLIQAAGILYDSYLRREREITLEQQLFQSQKMEALGTLAGGIAHDFNNILGAILGNTEIYMMGLPEEKKSDHYLNNIIESTERASLLVKQILTFSRMDPPSFKPMNLATVIREAIKMVRSTIPSKIKIKESIQEHAPVALADTTQIHQIVVNLCTNAYHAMEKEGGTIDILFHEAVQDNEPCLVLTVQDTGIGISAKNQERIFDPFFTTKEVGKGTGLGLAVVHGIVESHKGKIIVKSKPNEGTTFHITFPIAKIQEPPVISKTEFSNSTHNGHILFVEDDLKLFELHQEFLKKLGYRVTACTEGAEALRLFEANADQFDLIFTDQDMPNMTGQQLSQAILGIRPTLPIVLTTGYSSLFSEEEAHAMGIRKYLMKPLKLSSLREALDDCLKPKK